MKSVLENTPIDLIVLDVMMPGDDGLTLCRFLRESRFKEIPILLLTARVDDADRILGLEMGADDYLAKPFVARELLARIHSVLRRTRMLPPNFHAKDSGRLLCFGEWRLDTVARHLVDRSGVIVSLAVRNIGCCVFFSIIRSAC
jgi:two-component system OmpR family response regulator